MRVIQTLVGFLSFQSLAGSALIIHYAISRSICLLWLETYLKVLNAMRGLLIDVDQKSDLCTALDASALGVNGCEIDVI